MRTNTFSPKLPAMNSVFIGITGALGIAVLVSYYAILQTSETRKEALGMWKTSSADLRFVLWALATPITAAAFVVVWYNIAFSTAPKRTIDLLIVTVFLLCALFWSLAILQRYLTGEIRAVWLTAIASAGLFLTVQHNNTDVPKALLWFSAAWVVFHHLIIDGIFWNVPIMKQKRSSTRFIRFKQDYDFLSWQHAFACFVHFVAFIFLLSFAAHKSDQDLSVYSRQYWINTKKYDPFSPRRWLYNCYDSESNVFLETSSCEDGDKRFFVESVDHKIPVNVLAWASFYVAWSSLLHGVAAVYPRWTRELRWFDYSVTAPTMLFVLALAFGSDSVTALVIMPFILSILLVIAWLCEQKTTFGVNAMYQRVCEPLEKLVSGGSNAVFTPWSKMRAQRRVAIILIILIYGVTIAPVLVTSILITKEQDPLDSRTGVGTAPQYVLWFSILTLIFFSSFAVVYVINLVKDFDREKYYIYLSMISKTTLHLFLGLAVIQQSNVVAIDEANADAADMDTVQKGLLGALGLIAGLGLFFFFGLKPLYRRFHPKDSKQRERAQAQLLMALFE